MNVIPHLIWKDLRRLRVAVAMLSLGVIAKMIFLGVVAGLFSSPNTEWLQRLQSGLEGVLRVVAEPLIAYLLIGWLVFEDPPAEKDSHWITLPITGHQLFVSKLATSVLLFVLLPLAMRIAWWLGCGLGWSEITWPSLQLCLLNLLLVSVALAAASLTDGFPRFVLWSLVSAGSFFMAQIILSPRIGGTVDVIYSRILIWCIGGTIVSLFLAGYQYATRRTKRTLSFALVGLVAVAGLSLVWQRGEAREENSESADLANVRLKVEGPAHDEILGNGRNKNHFARIKASIADLPHDALISSGEITGVWRLRGNTVWTSRGWAAPYALNSARRTLGLKGPLSDEEMHLLLPFSPKVLRDAANEPFEFSGKVRLDLFRGRIVADFPFREVARPFGGKAFTISQLSLSENAQTVIPRDASEPTSNWITVVLTERSFSPDFLSAALMLKRPDGYGPTPSGSHTLHLLVDRATGTFVIYDWTKSERVASVSLDQTTIASWKFVFPFRGDPSRLSDYSFVAVRFDHAESFHRDLNEDRLAFDKKRPSKTQ